jgi:hypothetical protein
VGCKCDRLAPTSGPLIWAGGAASGCSEILPAVTPGADPILEGKSPVLSTGCAAPRRAEPGRACPDSHLSWRPTAMGVLSEIDGEALCYQAFPQAARLRQYRRDGVHRRPRAPGKVAIRRYCPTAPGRGPVLRYRVGPGREPDSSNRHVRTFGAYRDFAGA